MSKTKDTTSKPEHRELTDSELNAVTGGSGSANTRVNHSEFTIVKLVDAATPKLF
jgi:bacteriocin-like protein